MRFGFRLHAAGSRCVPAPDFISQQVLWQRTAKEVTHCQLDNLSASTAGAGWARGNVHMLGDDHSIVAGPIQQRHHPCLPSHEECTMSVPCTVCGAKIIVIREGGVPFSEYNRNLVLFSSRRSMFLGSKIVTKHGKGPGSAPQRENSSKHPRAPLKSSSQMWNQALAAPFPLPLFPRSIQQPPTSPLCHRVHAKFVNCC
jgi:hypothetical protein